MDIQPTDCKICGSASEQAFRKLVLQKYEVSFYRCSECGFMQSEDPYWLREAYLIPLSITDTGLIQRPLQMSSKVECLILKYLNPRGMFLDYGGGNGVFTRIMRDKGFNFYHYDRYTQNVFAVGFDLSDIMEQKPDFELVTAIEVIEHLSDPVEDMGKLFCFSDNVLVTTLLQEQADIDDLENWDYLGEFNGQHVSLYTLESLNILAEKHGRFCYSDRFSTHFFSRKKISNFSFSERYDVSFPHFIRNRFVKYVDRMYFAFFGKKHEKLPQSLTMKDQENLRNRISK